MKNIFALALGQVYKIMSVRSFWIGIFLISIACAYFTYLGTVLFHDPLMSLNNGFVIELSGEQKKYEYALVELIIGPHVQSICIFFPLLIAYISGREIKFHQNRWDFLVSPERTRYILSRSISLLLVVVIFCAITYIATSIWFVLQYYPDPAFEILTSFSSILFLLRIIVYTFVLTMIAESVTWLFGNSLGGLGFMILMIAISLSGVLSAVSPVLHNSSPILILEPFILGRAKYENQLSNLFSNIDMFVHLLAALGIFHYAIRSKDM